VSHAPLIDMLLRMLIDYRSAGAGRPNPNPRQRPQ
jgi:hypothetical protein